MTDDQITNISFMEWLFFITQTQTILCIILIRISYQQVQQPDPINKVIRSLKQNCPAKCFLHLSQQNFNK